MADRENRDNRDTNATDLGKMNQQIGRELYERDKQQQQPQNRYASRREEPRKWDEGNFFHTGPSRRGAQDRPHNPQGNSRGGSSPSTYHTGQGTQPGNHYGGRSESPYRNEDTYLNRGNRPYGTQGYYTPGGNAGGQQPGNYNEPPTSQDSLWREGPGTRSRYKETDYRYGSGSHNWYHEGRYTPDEPRQEPRTSDRSFFQRLRHTWDDIMHSDDPEWQARDQRNRDNYIRDNRVSDRQRYGSEPYQDRNFDRGYEGGPRWADETDSGKK